MPDLPFNQFRLALMQDALPMGIAFLERIRQGGVKKVVEVFSTSEDPLSDLKNEGDEAASSLREQLDQLSPGLGNPVMEVEIDVVENIDFQQDVTLDEQSLMPILSRIRDRLDCLEVYLKQNTV